MKINPSLFTSVRIIVLALALGLGTSYLSAFTNTWTAPPAGTVAPANNMEAPINAGAVSQYKAGALSLGSAALPAAGAMLDVNGAISATNLLLTGTVTIAGGSPGAGKVLTSDASGLASWQAAGGGGLSIIGPLTESAATASAAQNQVSFNLPTAGDVIIFAYVSAASDAGSYNYVKLLVDDVLKRTGYYGEECSKACSSGAASVVLSSRQTLTAGTHNLKVQTPGGRPYIINTPTDVGVQFYVYVLNGTGTTGGAGTSVAGVTKIIAGSGVTVSPVGGTGDVTVSASGAAASGASGLTGTWCGVFTESGAGGNHDFSTIKSCGTNSPSGFIGLTTDTNLGCSSGYTKFTFFTSGANTNANPTVNKFTCVKD